MKVIISHDVDTIRTWEHRTDLIIPKFLIRFGLGFLSGRTGWRETTLAVRSLGSRYWHNIDELMDFDLAHRIPSTFFVAVNRGRKLAYSTTDAKVAIAKIRARGFDIGLHGIDYHPIEKARTELDSFREIAGEEPIGVRIHNIGYTRSSIMLFDSDVVNLKAAGHRFSSTTFGEAGPWFSGEFWEFPIHLMEGHIFEAGSGSKKRILDEVKKTTIMRLSGAAANGVSHFSVLFHDLYFCDYYSSYRDWYVWLFECLRDSGYELCSYRQALSELNGCREPEPARWT
jgi:hypothetical protein